MKNIVVAYDKNRGIGAENDPLWLRDLPEDLKHFKELTMGHDIVMGRKTFESIGKPLPGRNNIVLSRRSIDMPGITVVRTLEEAFAASGDIVDVIGGGQVFEQALSYVDIVYATEVLATFPQATVFFTELDASQWREVSRECHVADEKNKYDFDFVVYKRM